MKEYEAGYVIGTADYLAPEQTIDSRVDIRADIYTAWARKSLLLSGGPQPVSGKGRRRENDLASGASAEVFARAAA
ncbi:MAG: hypothetical protein U0744_06855 [Gemmataceae bacterium]